MTVQLASLLLEGPSNNGMKKNEEIGVSILHCQSSELWWVVCFLFLLLVLSFFSLLHLPQVSKTFLLRYISTFENSSLLLKCNVKVPLRLNPFSPISGTVKC